MGAFDDNKIKRILSLDKDIKPQAIVVLGYSDEKGVLKRNKLQNFVFFEKYGNKKRDLSLLK